MLDKKHTLLTELNLLAKLGDTEIAHSLADDALLAYIDDTEVLEAYARIDKWYS